MFPLGEEEFRYIARVMYEYAGINLTDKKRSLVISRLSKRIRALGLSGFREYTEYLKYYDRQKKEFHKMVDAISTNFTSFFREPHHLDFLTHEIYPHLSPPVNIWSAAASMGQEIYSILIGLREYERVYGLSLKPSFYASDVSRQALYTASQGIYTEKEIEKVSPDLRKRYFLQGRGNMEGTAKVKNEYIRQVSFFRMNLKDETYNIPMMDIVFLRNAIIYFDRETKMDLMERLYHYIKPGGYLFLGHSESLSGISDRFKVAGRTIYQKAEEQEE